jgi:hypothetical protein
MVFIKRWVKFMGLVPLLGLLAACSQSGPSVFGEMEDQVGWVIGNVAPEYWSDGSGASAMIDLSVTFKDPNIEVKDIDEVEITNSLALGRSWLFTPDMLANLFYTSQRTGQKRIAFIPLSSSLLTTNKSAIYLGKYTIEVRLKNGQRSSVSLETPAPNALTSRGYSYAYSPEDYVGTPPSNYVALPKRATVESVALNATSDTLNLNFSVNDDKIYSGWVLLFDGANEFLGYAGDFRDFSTKAIHSKLNGGLEFRTNGTSNTLALSAADIQVSSEVSNFSLSMVKSVRIILTDGKQYASDTNSTYDTYSYSVGTVN